MRTHSILVSWLVLPGVLLGGPAIGVATAAEDDSTLTIIEEYVEDEQAPATREQLETLSDVRLADDRYLISRSPLGLNALADLAVVRPVNIGLGVFSAATYVLAFGPTLASSADAHSKLVDDLLVEPWRLMWRRPLGSPLDYRARDAAESVEPVPGDTEVEIPIEG
jgi:hypothetical protein